MTLADFALLASAAVNVFLAMHAGRSRRLTERAITVAECCLDQMKVYRQIAEQAVSEDQP